jgi:putative membrane protein
MNSQWLNAASILGSVLFALIGVIVFWLSFVIIDKMTPYHLWTEIGSMSLGISIIVAAAIHG